MKRLLLILMILFFSIASAQGTKTVAVKVSNQTQLLNNKEYYFHIVEQGQTVFSIARAYGLKYYDAVIKTDIHLLKVGDTVWLPKNEYSTAAVVSNAEAQLKADRVHYIKVDAGQTLYSLAREYGVTVDAIVEANPELSNQQLKAGQMLKIPPKSNIDAAQKQKEAEQQRLAEEKKQAEQQRLAEEKRQAEQQRLAEEKRQAEQKRLAEEKKQAEQKRLAEEKKSEESKSTSKSVSTSQTTVNTQSNTVTVTSDLSDEQPDFKPAPKPVQNPYPFDEVPSSFPTTQSNFFNFTTPSSFSYQVRERQDKQRLFISVVMPLNLDKLDMISTSKFDIEQRGKKEYKVFEFVQFYEGILIALDELQARGLDIVLNVVDISSDKDEDVVAAFNSHNVANSDFIIALLVKRPFAKLAQLAKDNQIFVINPFSSRADVVADNPYVIKCMPSVKGTVSGMLDLVAKRHKNGNLYIIHSNNKSVASSEKEFREEFQKQLEQRKDIKYTFFDWSANGKLLNTLKSTSDNVIISIYDQDKNKNMLFATTLLNRLSPLNSNVPVLFTVTNYLNDFPSLDFEQLQHVNYTSVTMGYLDYNNIKHKEFIDNYKEKFRTEPNTLYAGVAHDIMLYFATALWQKGAEFWRNPEQFKSPMGMLFPFSLVQSSSTGGYENQSPDIYQMQNFRLVPLVSH